MKYVCLLLYLTASLFAQVGNDGSLVGTITDPTGAVLPGASVVATNVATGLKWTVLSDSSGNFNILPLPAGAYSIEASAKGFNRLTVTDINLPIGQIIRIPIRLELGQVVQTTHVEARVELLQADKASIDTVVEEQVIKDLPLNGRDPIGMANLAPGVLYSGRIGFDLESTITPAGHRQDQTEFLLDGMNSNTVVDERGSGFPNVDSIAEFNVQTANFSAENGRNPVVLRLITKSGSNQFHGSLFEFLRNNDFNARNTFASNVPKLDFNQFGGTFGGPVIRNKTFFFFSYQGTRISQQAVQTFVVPSDAQFSGAFPTTITDPLTGQPFPNNTIPKSRINSSSAYFFPYLLHSNAPDGLYHNVLPNPDANDNYVGRVDHQITNSQRIYGRLIVVSDNSMPPQYSPSITQHNHVKQYNGSLSYDYTITPHMIFTLSGATFFSENVYGSPNIGKVNYTEESGIQGFATAGREIAIGLPNFINFFPYTGLTTPTVPYLINSETLNGKTSLNWVINKHTVTAGYEYFTNMVYARMGEAFTRGGFNFNGQYTGDAFADYLLGDIAQSSRSYPDETYGVQHDPFHGVFVQDNWKITSKVTLDLGLRWEYWGNKAFVRGVGVTFDPSIGKAVAGENNKGQVDLTAQVVAPELAAATAGDWVPASKVGYPRGLYRPNGVIEPRIGIAWRPFDSSGLVIRAAYGLFASNFAGNVTGSALIGPPYFAYQSQHWGPSQVQNWQTAWPNNPAFFTAPAIYAAGVNDKAMKTHEWNFSIEKTLPFKSSVTVSYVGNSSPNLVVANSLNVAPPGNYPNLQAAVPYPALGLIWLYQNISSSNFNSALVRWEKRYSSSLVSSFNYSFSKSLVHNDAGGFGGAAGGGGGGGLYDTPVPYAPPGYNNGRSALDHTHILSASMVWNLPFGRGRRYGSSIPSSLNFLFGGWELSGIYTFVSGDPLTFDVPGATLGNGLDTRPTLVGNPRLSKPGPNLWFNPAAFIAPPLYTFGNSGIGILDGPATNSLNIGLIKKFNVTERKYFQFRWELFNALNHVNYGDPYTTINQGSSTGQIFSAGDPRIMQLALKFLF